MRPSHPPTLLTRARRLVREERLWRRGDRVLVAVSGGGDSIALLHVAALLRDELGHELVAHGVDHGLRPEARAELDLAEELARGLDVPMTRSTLELKGGGNLQARAREARLRALREAAARTSARVIATAHHGDDRAETVLLRLLRGSGPRGLAVMPPRAGDLVRPLLRARKRDILAHLDRHHLSYATDPSNTDPRFLRVRVRHELLPLLERLSPGIVKHLLALADQLGALHEEEMPVLSRPAEELPLPLPLSRGARYALRRLARTKSRNARVLLPQGVVASYDRDKVCLVSPAKAVRWKNR
jgi:tRNA(Ile)-lysidine synthase